MEDTQKLYESNPYLTQFTSTVVSCERIEDGFAVVLESTAFFPEGGGQPCDLGTLGGANVLLVRERDGQIVHTTDAPLPSGQSVQGVLDWQRRFLNMQQHSGEHILSGVIKRHYGLDNVGFHIGSDAVTVDFNGPLSREEIAQAEREANAVVFSNIPIFVSFPASEELRYMTYRSKKEIAGQVRIVFIEGCDTCACCGTHVASTGEVGLVKILSAQNYKGGARTSILCGGCALADYIAKNEAAYDISALLSVRPNETVAGVERVLGEAASLRRANAQLQEKLFSLRAMSLCAHAQRPAVFESELSPADLRLFCAALYGYGQTRAAIVLSGSDAEGYKYALGSANEDVRPLAKALGAALCGRGGGSAELAQGVLDAPRQQLEFFLREQGFELV